MNGVEGLVFILVLALLVFVTNYIIFRHVWEWWLGVEGAKDK